MNAFSLDTRALSLDIGEKRSLAKERFALDTRALSLNHEEKRSLANKRFCPRYARAEPGYRGKAFIS